MTPEDRDAFKAEIMGKIMECLESGIADAGNDLLSALGDCMKENCAEPSDAEDETFEFDLS